MKTFLIIATLILSCSLVNAETFTANIKSMQYGQGGESRGNIVFLTFENVTGSDCQYSFDGAFFNLNKDVPKSAIRMLEDYFLNNKTITFHTRHSCSSSRAELVAFEFAKPQPAE